MTSNSRNDSGLRCWLVTDAGLPNDIPVGDGAWNMAVDEYLMEWAETHQTCCLRFYAWRPATISLGYFQQVGERVRHLASRDCAMVRRATGGGAILHDRELTYSLVAPKDHPLGQRRLELYSDMHQIFIDAFRQYGINTRLFGCDSSPPVGCGGVLESGTTGRPLVGCGDDDSPGDDNFSSDSPVGATKPFLCFERRSPGDIVVDRPDGRNFKIVGSAQRRSRGAILQHGSVLLERSEYAPELPGLLDLDEFRDSRPWDDIYEELAIRCKTKLCEQWRLDLDERPLGRSDTLRVLQIRNEKFASDNWTIDKLRK